MLDTGAFGAMLALHGFRFFSGVPCSYLKDLLNYAINDCEYVRAANEGDAVAICAGAHLGGRRAVVMMQNSGLTNAVSPLTSLNRIFDIPVLGFVSLRGEPGRTDEPQHRLMGTITTQLLDLLGIEWEFLEPDLARAKVQLERAVIAYESHRCFFFVVKQGTFASVALRSAPRGAFRGGIARRETGGEACARSLPSRIEALEEIVRQCTPSTAIISTTGVTSRELYELGDRPNQLYVVGSMGCASSIALGVALACPQQRVVCIDGDGAVLMRMGALATNAFYAPPNLLHIVLDNEAHGSTGDQATVSESLRFADVAASVGYGRSVPCPTLSALTGEIKRWFDSPVTALLDLKIAQGQRSAIARPHVSPPEVRQRFMHFLGVA